MPDLCSILAAGGTKIDTNITPTPPAPPDEPEPPTPPAPLSLWMNPNHRSHLDTRRKTPSPSDLTRFAPSRPQAPCAGPGRVGQPGADRGRTARRAAAAARTPSRRPPPPRAWRGWRRPETPRRPGCRRGMSATPTRFEPAGSAHPRLPHGPMPSPARGHPAAAPPVPDRRAPPVPARPRRPAAPT